MNIRNVAASAAALSFVLSFGVANAATSLSVSCSGVPATSAIAWTASTSGGVAPIALLWGNGSTSTGQTISYAPGTYSMSIQATDASSSVATSTCSATVAPSPSAPVIASFTASPASITSGQSTTLSWSVSNASTTSLDSGIGVVASSSIVVSPTENTTYTLTASNPAGTSTAQALVIVNSTSTPSSIQAQIDALLQQIVQLQQQIRNLLAEASNIVVPQPPAVPPGQIGKGMCITLNRDLEEGDDGGDVMQVQLLLAGDPFSGFDVAPTGFFGPLTMHAMMRFQEEYGIASSSSTDGSVGPLTRGFFERHCGEGLGNGESETGASSTEPRDNAVDDSTSTSAQDQNQNQNFLPRSHGEDHGQSENHGQDHGRGD